MIIREIVDNGTFFYVAGAHYELVCWYFENNPGQLALNVTLPDAFWLEILVNEVGNYKFYVIGKNITKLCRHKTMRKMLITYDNQNQYGNDCKRLILGIPHMLYI